MYRRNLKGTKLKRAFLKNNSRRHLQLLNTGLTSWELQFTEASVLRYIRPKYPSQSFDDRIVEIESAAPGRTSERFVDNQLNNILQRWPSHQWPSYPGNPFE